mmetsp:Transcript_49301/g.114275  ORF Transcript_49301/g.114275 Transcript_49301/m.114275 type:complete len:141 (-) Transcript_49301:102-524(-)|eukprot:CAMPEP_0171074304 /NCGR_PEP_ID=MMETSP0766_2-20121228/12057_1 /TAXON_ID=439317 /ORGANISM="Gambierdiscus australes, Strain CAWD 149" /LENGTH=140 /DNA_ID=CAMNT_0011531075 /DNA_START=94 /DNA_END=516 /DNA_ORIENTATION=+
MEEAWKQHYIKVLAAKGVKIGPVVEEHKALPAPKRDTGPQKPLEESLKDVAARLRGAPGEERSLAAERAQEIAGFSMGPEFEAAKDHADDVLANMDGRRWLPKLRVAPLPGKRPLWESTWARSMKKHTPFAQANIHVMHV